MTQPYVGEVTIYAFNFAPRDWAYCNGAQVAIAQNPALFSIIGTTYGGNGTTTFALPNIQNNAVMAQGQGPGLSNYALGQLSGQDTVTLNQQQMPAHNHTISGYGPANQTDFKLAPFQNCWLGTREGGASTDFLFTQNPGGNQFFAAQVVSMAGNTQPHMNQQPSIGMNFCIALYGIFPSRN